MSETSGFFNASLVDGEYVPSYHAEHFASYFANFISNGVFADPSDQLMVVAKEGLTVTVKAGKAYINGYWYTLSEDKDITFLPNMEGATTNNVVVCELDLTSKSITTHEKTNVSSILPDSNELVLCSFSLPVGTSTITQVMLTDHRPDKSYCGFVTGLVQQIDFKTLMEQEKAQFDEWFNEMKGQLSQDAAGNLQNQLNVLSTSFNGAIDDLSKNIRETYLQKYKYIQNGAGWDNTVGRKNGYVPGLYNEYMRSWFNGSYAHQDPGWYRDWRGIASLSVNRLTMSSSGDSEDWEDANGVRCAFWTLNFTWLKIGVWARCNEGKGLGKDGYTYLRMKNPKYSFHVNDIVNGVSDYYGISNVIVNKSGNLKTSQEYCIEETLYDINANPGCDIRIWFCFGSWDYVEGTSENLSFVDYKESGRLYGIIINSYIITPKSGYDFSGSVNVGVFWDVDIEGNGYKPEKEESKSIGMGTAFDDWRE